MLSDLILLLIAQSGRGLSPWLILVIFLVIVFIVAWAMLRNTDDSGADVEAPEHVEEEASAEEAKVEEVAEVDDDGNLLIEREALIETIRATKGYEGLSGTISCDEFGDCGTTEVEPEPEPEPELEPEPESVESDDLKKIEGIGPKVASILNENGILTFVQLAEADVDKLNEMLDAASLQMMDPATWPEQAKLAAAGDWDALQKLQDELSGGR